MNTQVATINYREQTRPGRARGHPAHRLPLCCVIIMSPGLSEIFESRESSYRLIPRARIWSLLIARCAITCEGVQAAPLRAVLVATVLRGTAQGAGAGGRLTSYTDMSLPFNSMRLTLYQASRPLLYALKHRLPSSYT